MTEPTPLNRPLRAIMVEDSDLDAEYLSVFLSRDLPGSAIHRIRDVEELREAIPAVRPDILLTDFTLARGTALDVIMIARHLRPMLPIIVISGTLDDETAVACIKHGADDYVLKDRIHRLPAAMRNAVFTRRISERNQEIERKAVEHEQRLTRLAESSSDIIYRYRLRPVPGFEYVSPSVTSITGYTPADHYENPMLGFDIIHPEDRHLLSRLIEGRVFDTLMTLRWQRRDGSPFWVEQRNVPVYDDDGVLIAIEGIARDITERKHAEQLIIEARDRAERADRLKSAFIANISHEIRTPLNIIIGYASLLHDMVPEDLANDVDTCFQSMQRSADRLMRTVGEILSISSIQSGTFSVHRELLDVTTVLDSIVADMQTQAGEAGLVLECRYDLSDVLVLSDRYCLEQALFNLIENAIKFTRAGGVFVMARTSELHVHIEVTDTGVGIAPDFLPHVFDVFSQEESGYTRPFEGIGLGMTLAKRYIEANEGTLDIQSEKGIGTKITVHLPRAATQPGTAH